MAIVGPSGSGKTTTLNLIGGLDTPTSGELIVAGSNIMRYYLLYSGLIAVIGAVLGFALSYPVGQGFVQAYSAEFGLPFVTAHYHLAAGLEAVGITLAVALLAALFPAWASARIAPAQAMRFDPSVALVKGSVPWLERALGLIFHLRTGTKLALRNLFRNRRRTLTTVLGFVFAFIVLLTCWAMFDGMGHMMTVQFQQTDRWDLQAIFSQSQPYALMEQIKGWAGVDVVEPLIEFPVTIVSGSESTTPSWWPSPLTACCTVSNFPRAKRQPRCWCPAMHCFPPTWAKSGASKRAIRLPSRRPWAVSRSSWTPAMPR